jgi:hypothetical protein
VPRITPKRLQFDRPCDAPECKFGTMVLIEQVRWGGRLAEVSGEVVTGTCLTHVGVLFEKLAATPGEAGDCLACAEPRGTCVQLRDTDWHGTLCRGHAMAFLSHTLDPVAFRRLVADAGGDPEAVFALHEDFYDADSGVAWQPYPLGMDALHEFVAGLEVLPDFEPEDATVDPEVARMYLLAKDGYRAATGLELHDPVAWNMVAESLFAEEFRRQRGEES